MNLMEAYEPLVEEELRAIIPGVSSSEVFHQMEYLSLSFEEDSTIPTVRLAGGAGRSRPAMMGKYFNMGVAVEQRIKNRVQERVQVLYRHTIEVHQPLEI